MVLALVVGDLHVPHRAAGVPEAFRKMFVPGRIQMVFVTGNVGCRDMFDYFRTVSPQVYCTSGECDASWSTALPETIVVEVEGLKIGLLHGHQVIPVGDKDALGMMQRQLGVDVLLSGATHVTRISEFDNHLFVNPGSITGAMAPTELGVVPSFVLLDIRDKTVNVFTYRYDPDGDSADGGREGEDGGQTAPHGPHTDTRIEIKKKTWTKE